jgi:hypothetical protein
MLLKRLSSGKYESNMRRLVKMVPEQEPMMEAKENPHELPHVAPAPPVFP